MLNSLDALKADLEQFGKRQRAFRTPQTDAAGRLAPLTTLSTMFHVGHRHDEATVIQHLASV